MLKKVHSSGVTCIQYDTNSKWVLIYSYFNFILIILFISIIDKIKYDISIQLLNDKSNVVWNLNLIID